MSRPLATQPDPVQRDMIYVYTVLSRRSGGLSIGINLNPNRACNWRCVYCQVPGLIRGVAPDIDLARLEAELRSLLESMLYGDFYECHGLSPEHRIIRDIAIAGNGEPTGSPMFEAVIGLIGQVVAEYDLLDQISRVLITNGSLLHKPEVQRGLAHWSELGGQVWFKLDSGSEEGIRRVNNVNLSLSHVRRNLELCARLCPTWVQTCLFEFDGQAPDEGEQDAYLSFLSSLRQDGIAIEGVLIYGLDRPSSQPEGSRLKALPVFWLQAFGQRVEGLGLVAKIHA